MAVVLQADDGDLFSSSPLRRSHSQPRFNPQQSSSLCNSTTPTFRDAYRQPFHAVPDSSPSSSTPSSPRAFHPDADVDVDADSTDMSYSSTSTPATNLSLDGHYDEELYSKIEDAMDVDHNPYFAIANGLEEQLPTIQPNNSHDASPTEPHTSADTSRPVSPEVNEHAEDDTAVKQHPTQHVDYLSHNWKEEDIWSSWRYIVSKRGDYSNGPRLENASWRTWMKAKYRLRTVSPETLNWLKDCDVTWLYGPLQTQQKRHLTAGTDPGSSALSRCDSFVKKPILKKRSMSEIMLQRSLSSSSLLKQAAAVVQAQQGVSGASRPAFQRAATDYITLPLASTARSCRNTSVDPSTDTSGVVSPSVERKHIHFDEQVKQCIAVEEEEEDFDLDPRWPPNDYDSDSDDGAVMMKTTRFRKNPLYTRRKPQPSASNESKTIAMLPSTTLKYRTDSPEPNEAILRAGGHSLKSPTLSPSPSQETLRPSRKSGSLLGVGDENNGADNDSASGPRGSTCSKHIDGTSGASTPEPEGMRRTESGMFMPADEIDAQSNSGLVGRVVDTVNTARDIVHVIWNVGWKR